MNFPCLSLLAASRTLCNPLDASIRLCVRHAVVCSVFSLVGRLPSALSADGFSSLFDYFAGNTRPSDSPPAFMLDFGLMAFSSRPVHCIVSGVGGVSRFSRVEFPCMHRVYDLAESSSRSPYRFRWCCLPSYGPRRHSEFRPFRGSIPGLHVPLSTLHAQSRNCPRMTRGRGGLLGLPRTTLSCATPRRFIPALP